MNSEMMNLVGCNKENLTILFSLMGYKKLAGIDNKNDLYTEVDVEFDDLILGCEIEVETITGKIALVLPANSQNNQKTAKIRPF